jgi:signal transduction histidine kinase
MRFGKTRRPRSLRARVLGVFVAGMVVSAALVAFGALVLAKPFSDYMLANSVAQYADGIARHVRFDRSGHPMGPNDDDAHAWMFAFFGKEIDLRILDDAGALAYAPDGGGHVLPEGMPFVPGRHVVAVAREGVALHVATTPLVHDGRTWFVQFVVSDRLLLQLRHSFGTLALWKGVAALCVTFLVVFAVTVTLALRRALAPLRTASDDARRITLRTMDARIADTAMPTEIRPLVESFNLVLDRLQRGFRTQQEFLASAAHELKTPLALIRAQVELGRLGQGRHGVLADVDRMARQVQQLLILAEASEPQNYRIAPVDPVAAMREAIDYMAPVAEQQQVPLRLVVEEDAREWHADRGALFTLVKNLLENAIQHSGSGDAVTVHAGPAGFTVADQGPGVAPENLARIFERFWRGKERREDGAGLGLSICQEIATAHEWRLLARPGLRGLEVSVLMASSGEAGAGQA